MSFETMSLPLNWMEMGALLAILFRLSSTFELIASTQRELRRTTNVSIAPLNWTSPTGSVGRARARFPVATGALATPRT
jgi:hypothetical protein